MPWTAKDAPRFTKKADTPEKRKRWAAVANRVLRETNDEGRAVREANAAVGGRPRKRRRRKKK